MLKDGLTRWVAPAVTGEVTVELRRGDDYTLLDTTAEYMAYAPDKLSMERVEEPAFTPEDRIGALELQNLSVGDNRALLLHHLEAVRALGRARPGAGLGAPFGSGKEEGGGGGGPAAAGGRRPLLQRKSWVGGCTAPAPLPWPSPGTGPAIGRDRR